MSILLLRHAHSYAMERTNENDKLPWQKSKGKFLRILRITAKNAPADFYKRCAKEEKTLENLQKMAEEYLHFATVLNDHYAKEPCSPEGVPGWTPLIILHFEMKAEVFGLMRYLCFHC
ncbi:hypothetical protein ACOME3_002321 [Neoechinorhynchus agilis]